MSTLIHIDTEYKQWIQTLSKRYRQCQIKAAVHVNHEMLAYYWELGRDIVKLHAEQRWGSGFMRSLSQDLQQELPDAKGLTQSNLYYCKKFYLLYNEDAIKFPQVVGKIENGNEPQLVSTIQSHLSVVPWGHHRYIMDKCEGSSDYWFVKAKIIRSHNTLWSPAVSLSAFLNMSYRNFIQQRLKVLFRQSQRLKAC